VRADDRFPTNGVFVHVRLHEPTKAEIAAYREGEQIARRLEALVVPADRLVAIEVGRVASHWRGCLWTCTTALRSAAVR